MASEELINGLGIAGTVLVFFMLCAQLPAMWTVVFRTKSVENLSVLPTIGQLMNFTAWTLYGIEVNDASVLQSNVIGIFFAVGYLCVFTTYSKPQSRHRLLKLLGIVCAVFGAVEIAIFLAVTDKDTRVTALGSVSVICAAIMYGAPIKQCYYALTKLDPSAVPALLTVANALVSADWLAYGVLKSNWFIAVPQAAGIFFGVIQLGIAGYINVRVRGDPSLTKRETKEEENEKSPVTCVTTCVTTFPASGNEPVNIVASV
eukprot:GDKI01037934.1.p1 GENE.GDKI01037934.1~~GDKI01037934.1.p1  ORF type:complete len:260 (-),score=68.33 GDKI01037934.1:37-816(-)